MCVGGLGVAVADDGVAIGEWVGIGIGHRGLNVSSPGRRGVRLGAHSGLKSDIARGPRMGWTGRAPAPNRSENDRGLEARGAHRHVP